MPNEGVDLLPYPNSSDIPDGPAAFLALASRLTLMKGAGVAFVADAAARAALVTSGFAYQDLLVLQSNTGVLYRYNASAWVVFEAAANSQRRNAVQSIATGATSQVVLSWDTAVLPLTAAFTLSAGVFTCVTAGVFEVTATADFAANATGNRAIYIRKNTTPIAPGGQNSVTGQAASIDASLTLYTTVSLAVSDTLDVAVGQASGGALNATGVVTINQIG